MLYILDTDLYSILDDDSMAAFNLGARLATIPPEEVAVSIITYEERMRGWLSYVAGAKTIERQLDAYRKLRLHVEWFCKIPLIDFGLTAATELERLRKARIQVGTMDLKIAAICLANHATLLTRNLKDFTRIPGLRVEDWSA